MASGAGFNGVPEKAKPPVREMTRAWVKLLGCEEESKPLATTIEGITTVVHIGGRDGTEVIFTTIEGHGHIWPGGKRVHPGFEWVMVESSGKGTPNARQRTLPAHSWPVLSMDGRRAFLGRNPRHTNRHQHPAANGIEIPARRASEGNHLDHFATEEPLLALRAGNTRQAAVVAGPLYETAHTDRGQRHMPREKKCARKDSNLQPSVPKCTQITLVNRRSPGVFGTSRAST